MQSYRRVQSEIAADDSGDYCDLLATLEADYDRLKEMSTQLMLDFDSLISYVRAAQSELRFGGLWVQVL